MSRTIRKRVSSDVPANHARGEETHTVVRRRDTGHGRRQGRAGSRRCVRNVSFSTSMPWERSVKVTGGSGKPTV